MNESGTHPSIAYPQAQREMHAEQHILICASRGSVWLENTISREVVKTYGLPESFIDTLKALKARFRNELSFGGEK